MERSRKLTSFSLQLLVLLSSFIAGNGQDTKLVPAIITFGDSAVDVGNNNYLPTLVKANFPPYGRDFTNHVATGRFCDGKLATDITADTLGFTSYPPAYLSPQASGNNLLNGVNFASASSGYDDRTALAYHAISLTQQVHYFKEYQSKLAKVAGSSRASSIIRDALYVVSFGSSDFAQSYYINPYLYKVYTPDQYSSLLIENFKGLIRNIHGLGARRIGVTSLPPLGCLPATITLFGYGSNSCVSRLNSDAQNFNRKLSSAANGLQKQLSGLRIAVFNIYNPLYDLVNNPSAHGFAEARRGCCGTGTVETAVLCNPKSPGTCSNASNYVFFDSVHPTQAANQVLADSLITDGIGLIS